ncbi:MAG: tetratricopeptide (TPR) repeat protein [Candidatus Omnitrophota bacterium]|jgi:tetratricopeptide (TPR) repeat protein
MSKHNHDHDHDHDHSNTKVKTKKAETKSRLVKNHANGQTDVLKAKVQKRSTHTPQDKVGHAIQAMLEISDRISNGLINSYKNVFVVDEAVDVGFHKERGIKSFEKGDIKRANEHLLEAIEHEDEEDQETLYYLGLTYAHMEDHEEALECLQKSENVGDDNADIIAEIIQCLFKLERYAEMVPYSERLIDLVPEKENASNYYYWGSALEKTEKPVLAAEKYRKAIDLEPRDPLYYHALGFVFENQGNHKDAIACFRKAMELEKESK